MKHLRKLGHKGVGLVSYWVSLHASGYNAKLAHVVRLLLRHGDWLDVSQSCRFCGQREYDDAVEPHTATCIVGIAENLLAELPAPKPATGQRAKYGAGYRKDFLGFADIACFRRKSPGMLLVQTTTKAQMATHLRTYRRTPQTREYILACLASGNRIAIHGWEKRTVANKSNAGSHVRWRLHEREVTAADMDLTPADRRAMEGNNEGAGISSDAGRKVKSPL
jgi:hypothetical protein